MLFKSSGTRKIYLLIIILLFDVSGFAQKKVYKNDIHNNQKVIITNHIDTQIIYNPTPRKAKLYLLDAGQLSRLVRNKSNNSFKNDKAFYTLKIGNPDSAIVYDAEFEIEFLQAFDTAYFEEQKSFYFFNKYGERDKEESISKDKKHIYYKASYVGAGFVIIIHVVTSDPAARFIPTGIGFLF